MAAIFSLPVKANAEELRFNQNEDSLISILALPTIQQPLEVQPVKVEPPKPKEPEVPKVAAPVEYIVIDGDHLTKIATAHNTTWLRLWEKNTNIVHPDRINPGDKLIIPTPEEVLTPRPLPEVVSIPVPTPAETAAATTPVSKPSYNTASYGGGNTYGEGYCTWYVKNMRGSTLPNGLGNANTWYSRAQAMGMAVGSEPRAGAVGTTTRGSLGHVVYVHSVNGNGTVNISDMNYQGLYVITHRTVPASEFLYIY